MADQGGSSGAAGAGGWAARFAAQMSSGGEFFDPAGLIEVAPEFDASAGQRRLATVAGAEPWCEVCSYVPPDALVSAATDVMTVTLAREPDGCWSVLADEAWGDQTVFADSAGWDVERAREACDRWLSDACLPRVASWVSVPSGGLHAHSVFADLALCEVCDRMVVGGTEVTVTRRRGLDDEAERRWVLCSSVECRDTALRLAGEFHRPAAAVVPLWPGVGA